MIDLKSLLTFLLGRFIERVIHVAQHRLIFIAQLAEFARRIVPAENVRRGDGRLVGVECGREFQRLARFERRQDEMHFTRLLAVGGVGAFGEQRRRGQLPDDRPALIVLEQNRVGFRKNGRQEDGDGDGRFGAILFAGRHGEVKRRGCGPRRQGQQGE